jgi:hypothetical protein
MKTLGRATVGVLAALLLGAVIVGIRSIPDVQRYLKVRRM